MRGWICDGSTKWWRFGYENSFSARLYNVDTLVKLRIIIINQNYLQKSL